MKNFWLHLLNKFGLLGIYRYLFFYTVRMHSLNTSLTEFWNKHSQKTGT